MQDYEITAVEDAYAASSWREVREARDRAMKFPKAAELVELLQQIIERKLAQEESESRSPANSSSSKSSFEADIDVDRQVQEAEQRRVIVAGGIPFTAPEPPFRNQREYDFSRRTAEASRPVVSLTACPNCVPDSPAPDCTGACQSPSFWSARRVTQQEFDAVQEQRELNAKRRARNE